MDAITPAGRDAAEHFDGPAGLVALWFGVLAGPIAWFLHLNTSYALVVYVCRSGSVWLLHVATLATLLVAAAGVLVAWRSWRLVSPSRRPIEATTAEAFLARATVTGAGTIPRSRFMAVGGLALSAFFLAVILMAWIPDLVLSPCEVGL